MMKSPIGLFACYFKSLLYVRMARQKHVYFCVCLLVGVSYSKVVYLVYYLHSHYLVYLVACYRYLFKVFTGRETGKK